MKKQSIPFPDRNEALAILPTAAAKAEEVLSALALPNYQAVILLIGSADNIDTKLLPPLTRLFGRGIARSAATAKAVILDGGTQAGVMQLMGEAVTAFDSQSPLIGVAPLSKVAYPGSDHSNGDTPGAQPFPFCPGGRT